MKTEAKQQLQTYHRAAVGRLVCQQSEWLLLDKINEKVWSVTLSLRWFSYIKLNVQKHSCKF